MSLAKHHERNCDGAKAAIAEVSGGDPTAYRNTRWDLEDSIQ